MFRSLDNGADATSGLLAMPLTSSIRSLQKQQTLSVHRPRRTIRRSLHLSKIQGTTP